MFLNRTAWFSNSVRQGSVNYWLSEGGVITSGRTADYLFSEDATCPDTQRVFESKDYLWNKVTVFHSLYLAACEKRHSVKTVSIGHYVLPPACVQDEVRKVAGRFIWEQEDAQSIGQGSHKFSKQTEDILSSETEDTSQGFEQSDKGSSENNATLCCEVRNYPVNNMFTGYISIAKLRKYSGELFDFRPGHLGFSVCDAYCYRQGRGSRR